MKEEKLTKKGGDYLLKSKGLSMPLFLLASLIVLVVVQSSYAFTIDGNWTDWGISVADNNGSSLTPSAGIISWTEDTDDEANNYKVGPGWGGQDFDAEAVYMAFDTVSGIDYLYFAVVSGARPDNGERYYEPGDITISTTNALYALETTGFRYNLDSSGYVTGTPTPTGIAGGLYQVDGNYSEGGTGDTLVMNGLPNWASSVDNVDPVQLYKADGTLIDSGNFFFTGDSATDQHSFMEGMVDLSLLDGNVNWVHWAYSCGNDGNPAPVPEPATMLLLGSGLIGLAGLGRRKFRKS